MAINQVHFSSYVDEVAKQLRREDPHGRCSTVDLERQSKIQGIEVFIDAADSIDDLKFLLRTLVTA